MLEIAWAFRGAGIVLGATLLTVILVSVLEEILPDLNRFVLCSVVIFVELCALVGLWFVVGLPGWVDPFLQWFGLFLILVFLAVALVEYRSQTGIGEKKRDSWIAILAVALIMSIAAVCKLLGFF